MQKKTTLYAVATVLLLNLTAADAAYVSIHSIVTDPSSFDRRTVTLQGTAGAVKETTSQRGNDYTTFKLQDGIFAWGHPPLGNGDHVQVEGVFERRTSSRPLHVL